MIYSNEEEMRRVSSVSRNVKFIILRGKIFRLSYVCNVFLLNLQLLEKIYLAHVFKFSSARIVRIFTYYIMKFFDLVISWKM